MIIHEEDYDKVNIVLIINNQCGLQALFGYIIYLCIQLYHILLKSDRIHTDSNKQLNLIFKTRLLDTNEGISEDLCHLLHTVTTNCFPLKSIEFHKSRHGIKLNLPDYFYLIFFGKNPSIRFEHRLNALEEFI
ncbi:unnamed protein product [Adineta steineri]|uniref:Uncharacterized protein n=1 Tax=Adineta steineri TaxID=433720 RepID=A0A818USZ3_9BILA|nr:unnamed protein product [Adineta steineri]